MVEVDPYDILVLGSGEYGKYLAWTMAAAGRRTDVFVKKLIGGSWPSVACLPSKNIIHSAKVRSLAGTCADVRIGNRSDSVSDIAGRKAHVKPTADADEPESKNQSAEHPQNAGTDENQIDQVLADSFPASDAPPWTLGVASPRSTRIRKQKRQRG